MVHALPTGTYTRAPHVHTHIHTRMQTQKLTTFKNSCTSSKKAAIETTKILALYKQI